VSRSEEIEAVIRATLSRISEESEFDMDRSLDDFGLDSVARVGLLAEIERRLAVSVSIEELIECQTPRAIISAITSRLKEIES